MAMVITQKFWEWGDPLPPLLGKIPKKYRFFFWKTPLTQINLMCEHVRQKDMDVDIDVEVDMDI